MARYREPLIIDYVFLFSHSILNFLNTNGYVIAVTDLDGKTISGMTTASQANATDIIAIGKD
jgi:hypothetical protein